MGSSGRTASVLKTGATSLAAILHFKKRYFGAFQRGTPFFPLRIKSSRAVLPNGGDFSLCVIFSFILNMERGWYKMGTDGWVEGQR